MVKKIPKDYDWTKNRKKPRKGKYPYEEWSKEPSGVLLIKDEDFNSSIESMRTILHMSAARLGMRCTVSIDEVDGKQALAVRYFEDDGKSNAKKTAKKAATKAKTKTSKKKSKT